MKKKPNYNSHQRRNLNVFVFRNLHQPGVVWSVRDDEGHTILHADNILVKNAKFVVQKGGQARVRLTRQKEIHAGVKGEVVVDPVQIAKIMPLMGAAAPQAFYNPYKNDTFVNFSNEELTEADWVLLTSTPEGKSAVKFVRGVRSLMVEQSPK